MAKKLVNFRNTNDFATVNIDARGHPIETGGIVWANCVKPVTPKPPGFVKFPKPCTHEDVGFNFAVNTGFGTGLVIPTEQGKP